MNKKYLSVFAIILLVCGVALFAYHRSRNVIPSEKRMAQILADIYIADALFQAQGNLYTAAQKNNKTTESTYHTILSRYNIDKVVFDSAVAWYSARPDAYANVYERVVNILTKRESDFSVFLDKRDSVAKVIERLNDSLRVSYWKGQKSVHVPVEPRDSVDGKYLRFEYDLDSIKGGKINFFMNYIFPHKNEAKKSPSVEMIVVYNDTISDTISSVLSLSHIQKKLEIEYAVRDTIKAVKLKFDLMKSDEYKKVSATVSNIEIKYMPYQITDSVQFDEILLPPLYSY